jgi:hypothetical protein
MLPKHLTRRFTGVDVRVRVRRRFYRRRVPFARRDARGDLAGNFPCRRVGRSVERDRTGSAIRKRRCADRLIRTRFERDDLRTGGDGVFRPACTSPIRLAERVGHDRGADCRSLILRPTAMFLRRIDDCVRKGLSPRADLCR